MPVRYSVPLIRGEYRFALIKVVLQEALLRISARQSEFAEKVEQLYKEVPYSVGKLAEHVSRTENAAVALKMMDAVPLYCDELLNACFAETAEGKALATYWNALLDDDGESLTERMKYFGEQQFHGYPVADLLFCALAKRAGVEVGRTNNYLRNAPNDIYTRSMCFMLDGQGLEATYQHVSQLCSSGRTTYTNAVVSGQIDHAGLFAPVGKPNNDPAAVQAMAVAISAKLRKHFELVAHAV